LSGYPKALWNRLRSEFHGSGKGYFSDVPPAYRPFIDAYITDWRGHRLFGLEEPPGNNFEDFQGRSCIIAVYGDPLLETVTENEYGFSIWCPHGDLKVGRFDRGMFVRHSSV
jgi:hypothetical protein